MNGNDSGIIRIVEELGIVKEKAKAAHQRLDRMEVVIREDLSEIIAELKGISNWMHTSKGWAAAIALMASLLGGLIATFAPRFIQ